MSDNSSIEWTDATWNPITGCAKVSPGCDHCYAERVTERFHGKGSFEQVVLHPDRLEQPLRWRKPRRVFVNSMSDLFHDSVPDEYIAQVWQAMYGSSKHTFQVLTKRHARLRAWVRRCAEWSGYITHNGNPPSSYGGDGVIVGVPERWPLANVWLGVSVEDQKWADIRIPALLDTPAAVRFLSCEPLLGPIDLTSDETWFQGFADCECEKHRYGCPSIDWVIAGGESGPDHRPVNLDWVRSLRDQCTAADVPFFFKQWGGRTPKANGRELDGRTWDEYPTALAGAR